MRKSVIITVQVGDLAFKGINISAHLTSDSGGAFNIKPGGLIRFYLPVEKVDGRDLSLLNAFIDDRDEPEAA